MKVRILFALFIIIMQLGVLLSHSISSDESKGFESSFNQTASLSSDTHNNQCETPFHSSKCQQHNCHFGHCSVLKPALIGLLDPLLSKEANLFHLSKIKINSLISSIERPPKA